MAIIDGRHTGGAGAGGGTSRTTTTFTGAVARGTEGGITYTRNGVVVREMTDAASLANLREETRAEGRHADAGGGDSGRADVRAARDGEFPRGARPSGNSARCRRWRGPTCAE